MTKADRGRTRTAISQAVIELFESRQLMAFTELGTVLVKGGETSSVTSMSMNEAGRYVVVGSDHSTSIVGNVTVDQNDVFINAFNAGNNSVIPGGAKVITTDHTSFRPDVAMTGTGSYIVVWQTEASGALSSAINMERFSLNGTSATLDVPTIVSSGVGDANAPRVAVADDQSFVVVWESNASGGFRVYQQRYDASGIASGAITMASDDNTATAPDVQMNADGTYVVVWNSASSTLAQRFDATGAKVGGIITVATVSSSQPAVGVAGDGSFVVAWSAGETSGSTTKNIVAQRYSAAGSAVGSNFIASSDTSGDQQFPQIGISTDGKFVIGWAFASTTPTQYDSIGFAPFTSAGARVSDDTIIRIETTDVIQAVNNINIFNDQNVFSELDNDIPSFGISWQDGLDVAVAFQLAPTAANVTQGDAALQKFSGNLAIDLDDNPHVVQLFGTPTSVTVTIDGVSNTYATELFTTLNVTTGDSADYIRAKNVTKAISVTSGAGDDTIIGSDGNDSIDSGAGNDAVNAGAGDDYVFAGDDQDTVYGGDGSDTLTGSAGRDLMFGENGDDLLNGGSRPDTLHGGLGNDRIRGGTGGDAIFGDDGNDELRGDSGNDGILGGNGNDYIQGDFISSIFDPFLVSDFPYGNDTIRGGDGNDTLLGQAGNDYLYGDLGSNQLDGGGIGTPANNFTQSDYGFNAVGASDSNIGIEVVRKYTYKRGS